MSVRDKLKNPQAKDLFVDDDGNYWLITDRDGDLVAYVVFEAIGLGRYTRDWEQLVYDSGCELRVATAAERDQFIARFITGAET